MRNCQVAIPQYTNSLSQVLQKNKKQMISMKTHTKSTTNNSTYKYFRICHFTVMYILLLILLVRSEGV